MIDIEKVFESLLNLRSLRGEPCYKHMLLHLIDEVTIPRDNIAVYLFHGYEFARYDDRSRVLMISNLCKYYRYDRDCFQRLTDIAKALKKLFGIDIEFSTMRICNEDKIIYRYCGHAYIFNYSIAVDVDRKVLDFMNSDSDKIYLDSKGIEQLMEFNIDDGLTLTIGIADGEPVAKFTKYNEKYIKRLSDLFGCIASTMSIYWVTLHRYPNYIRKMIEYINYNAAKEFEVLLKLLGYS